MDRKKITTESEKFGKEFYQKELNRAMKSLENCRSFVVMTTKDGGGELISAVQGISDMAQMGLNSHKFEKKMRKTICETIEKVKGEENG